MLIRGVRELLHNKGSDLFYAEPIWNLQLKSCTEETVPHTLQKRPGWKPQHELFNRLNLKWKTFNLTQTRPAARHFLHHSPIQTSPNWPAPSLRSSFRDSRGISHSSCHQGFWGALDWHGFTSFVHKPSESPGGGGWGWRS